MSEEQSLSGEQKGKESSLPEGNFIAHILMLATTATMHLGETPNPFTQKVEKNLALARYTIDTLAMLEEKTKGNLNEEEQKYLTELLYELRMKYIAISEGKSKPEG